MRDMFACVHKKENKPKRVQVLWVSLTFADIYKNIFRIDKDYQKKWMNSTDVRVHVSKSVSLYNAAVHFKTSTQDLKSTHTLFCLFVFGLDIFLNLYFKIN